MTGKKVKVAEVARGIFASNVKRLMEVRFSESPNKPRALAVLSGVTLSTIQRALSAENASTLDTVEAIATAFNLLPHQMLVENIPVESRSPSRLSLGNGLRDQHGGMALP